MPNVHFKCDNGHEFDKLIQAKHAIFKWCKHCNALTEWMQVLDPHHEHYKAKLCSRCLGNEHLPPMLSTEGDGHKEEVSTECPECGAVSRQHLAYHQYHRAGGDTVADSSLRFHFNYLPASDN